MICLIVLIIYQENTTYLLVRLIHKISIPPARVVRRTGLVWLCVVISLYCWALVALQRSEREGEREGEFEEGKMRNKAFPSSP